MYDTLIMVSETSNFTIEALKEKLEQFYSKNEKRSVQIERTNNRLSLTIETYNFEMVLNKEAHVIVESQEIAAEYASDRADQAEISACKKRFELFGDDDFDMDYFNDSLYIFELLEQFEGVYIFNPQDGSFINE